MSIVLVKGSASNAFFFFVSEISYPSCGASASRIYGLIKVDFRLQRDRDMPSKLPLISSCIETTAGGDRCRRNSGDSGGYRTCGVSKKNVKHRNFKDRDERSPERNHVSYSKSKRGIQRRVIKPAHAKRANSPRRIAVASVV